MTTRKPGSVAAVNRAIDAIIKKNPAKPSPPKRRVKLIAMNPGSSRNLAAPRAKKKENWPRYMVEEKSPGSVWLPRASFRLQEQAEEYAEAIARAYPEMALRVIDTKS